MAVMVRLSGDGPIYQQIYEGLRQSILTRRLAAGIKLPSTRDLALELGVSRTVVVLAYEHLLAEGYATGKTGSGTYVSAQLPEFSAVPTGLESADRRPGRFPDLSEYGKRVQGIDIQMPSEARKGRLVYDFRYGVPPLSLFPFAKWRKLMAARLREMTVKSLHYARPEGTLGLREQIAAYARKAKAAHADADQVMVVNGSQQALDLAARLLVKPQDTVVMEDPHYQGARQIFYASGARLEAVPVDAEGLDAARIRAAGAKLVYVTPSHQFPSGGTMTLTRRLKLLEWARQKNAYILEDDYDGEFRYESRPVESLQGLDTDGRVLYAGTFSKTLFPSLRIGYVILPKQLVEIFRKGKWLNDRHASTLEQETLADFLSTGEYERYLRRARTHYSHLRGVLLDAVERQIGPPVEIAGANAGVHIVMWLAKGVLAKEVAERAAAVGVGVYPIDGYYMRTPKRQGLLVGYGALTENQIRIGVERLAGVL